MGIGKLIKKRTLTNIILTLLVLSSVILSYSLWTTGRNIGEEESEQISGSPARISVITHSIEEVYRPKTIALHGITGENSLMIANSYDLIDFLEETMSNPSASDIQSTENLTKERYLDKIQTGEWLEFVYPAKFPIGMTRSLFTDLSTDAANQFFDRILFDQTDDSRLYFYHMASETFYTTEKNNNQSLINVEKIIEGEENPFQTAQAIFLMNSIKYVTTQATELAYQSYIINQFPNRLYINNFFPDTSLVDVRSTNNLTRYIDLTKEVAINENNHVLTYLSQIYTVDEMDPENRYQKSFQQVNQFENWSDSLIFTAYDQEKDMLTFRREIKGIPVFSQNDHESIAEISLVEDGITHMKLPMRYIDTPIKIKNSPQKTLIAGNKMIAKLRKLLSEDDFKKLTDFAIGYSWQESKEDSQVVNFEPDWYVYYDDNWLTYSELTALYKETVYGL